MGQDFDFDKCWKEIGILYPFAKNDEDVRYEFKDLSSDSNKKVFSVFEEENQKIFINNNF